MENKTYHLGALDLDSKPHVRAYLESELAHHEMRLQLSQVGECERVQGTLEIVEWIRTVLNESIDQSIKLDRALLS